MRQGGFDVAVLDINIRGDKSYPIADLLDAAGVPFIFATGYEAPPGRFHTAPLIQKPYAQREVASALARVLSR